MYVIVWLCICTGDNPQACVCMVRLSTKLVDYLTVQTHKLYNNIHICIVMLSYRCTICMLEVGWLLVGFVALRPKSTAMVIAGQSVHLTTLFPGQA